MPESPVASKLDPARSQFVTIVGRKGSGKSVLAHRLWETYPGDGLVIDPTGDFTTGPDTELVRDPLPLRWPLADLEEHPTKLRYVPDVGAPSYEDNLDRAAGLAYAHGNCLLVCDEVGELTRANKTLPHFRRVLRQGRHRRLSLVCCNPRALHIDPLVLSQADWVYIFTLPHPRDRETVAANIGVAPKVLDDAVHGLPEHGYLRYDARASELVEFPPLPLNRGARAAAAKPRA